MNKDKRVYIAEDEMNIRLGVKAFLENAGYIVLDFENGDLLMDAFFQSPPDLVILDIMMPGTNGFAICKELRRTSGIPIILLTARASDLDYETGFELGCSDYVTKPFSTIDLVSRVDGIFRRMETKGCDGSAVHG
jgi:DNA-binding response OmpR family regulator